MVHLIKEKTENRLGNEASTNEKENAYYQRLITDNIEYIEKQCHKACGVYKKKAISIHQPIGGSSSSQIEPMRVIVSGEIDPDTLFNEVLDRLKENNFRVLKDFKNLSKLTTYITTIIAHLIIDIKRKIEGRNRANERARAIGPLGEKLFDLVFIKGYPLEEAFSFLKRTNGITETLEEIETMVEKIKGRTPVHPHPGTFIEKDTPETALEIKQREALTKNALNEALTELSNGEKLIMRMRFPLSEDEEPKSLSEIAKMLRITEKAVDSRIRRVLTKCKEKILENGLNIDDFINA